MEKPSTEIIKSPSAEQHTGGFNIDTIRSMGNRAAERLQTATSYPYPKGNTGKDGPYINDTIRQSTFRQAHRDNRMLDQLMLEIARCEDKMEENKENGELGILSPFSVDNANSQIYSNTQILRGDIHLLKTSRKITSDDIESRNRGDFKRWHQATNGRLF